MLSVRAVFPLLLAAASAQGYYDRYYFNTVANHSCNGMASGSFYWCNAPNVCAHDNILNKYYCCSSGEKGGICRVSPTNYKVGSTQNCTAGNDTWFCLANVEQCTLRTATKDICWATTENPLENVSVALLNQTYQSLLSVELASAAATPSATTSQLWLNYTSLIAAATASPITSTDTSCGDGGFGSSTAAPAASSTGSSAAPSLSGGAIAGIVIGALAALALLVLGVVFFLRRRHRHGGQNATKHPYQPYDQPPPERHIPDASAQGHFAPHANEKSAGHGASELWAASERHEAPAADHPPPPFSHQELSAQRALVELSSDSR